MKANLVLIGMPGSGKSTVAKELSERLNLPYVDTDSLIEQLSGESIPELFEKSEEHFRSFETRVCEDIAKKESTIISTGGGIVVNRENIDALSQSGWIVFINRPLDLIFQDIEVPNRPLLAEGKQKLSKLYEERIHLYRQAADYIVENNSSIENVVQRIIQQTPASLKN